MKSLRSVVAVLILVVAGATFASAQGIVNLELDGNEVTGQISLPGLELADLRLTFDDPTGLSLSTLNLSAELVSPLDLGLLLRLPLSLQIPVGFPVLLKISPTSSSALGFHGMYTLELHTHDLLYLPASLLRLYKAPAGGQFVDITQYMGSGSYRVRGGGSSFSDFLIVLDLRFINTVINGKYNTLESTLNQYAAVIDDDVQDELADLWASSRSAFRRNDLNTAIADIDELIALVVDESGTGVPDFWQKGTGHQNAAGALRVAAGTLRFSLLFKKTNRL